MSSTSSPATHSELPLVTPLPSGKKREQRGYHWTDPQPGRVPAKKSKSADDIERNVRDLLHKKLFGKDDAVKVNALHELTQYLESPYEIPKRAIVEWDGCHLVLLALERELDSNDEALERELDSNDEALERELDSDEGANRTRQGDSNDEALEQELDSDEGAQERELEKAARANRTRQLVDAALTFLKCWNRGGTGRHDAMLRCKGVEIVVRAMRVVPDDPDIKLEGIACFYYFTRDKHGKYLKELVKEECIPLLAQAMKDSSNGALTREFSLIILGRLCKVAVPANFKSHVDARAFGALLSMFQEFESSGMRQAPEVIDSCRALASKMLE
jgi:hypothetical protein